MQGNGAHNRELYREIIQAATDGKLLISDRSEIESIAGERIASWDIGSLTDIGRVRDGVAALARQAGMSDSRIYDFMSCTVEASGNAYKHAHCARASLHRDRNRLTFVVSDCGSGICARALPSIVMTRGYSTTGTLGMGYKVMPHFADKIYLATGPEGTTVAAEMAL